MGGGHSNLFDTPTLRGPTALVGDPKGGAAGTGAATVESFFGGWGVSASLAPPSAPALFGTSVSLDGAGTTALVGDPTGGAVGTGTASVYTLSTSWSGANPLGLPIGAATYGTSVALSYDGSAALVGDPTGGNGFGWVTTFTSSGSLWSLGTAATPPATAYSFGQCSRPVDQRLDSARGRPPSEHIHRRCLHLRLQRDVAVGTPLTPPASSATFGSSARGFGERHNGCRRGSRNHSHWCG